MAALFFRKRIKIKCAEPLGVAMTTVCPICKSPAQQELDRSGDAISFHCPTHGDFKVADDVFAGPRLRTTPQSNGRPHWTRQRNERSLRRGL